MNGGVQTRWVVCPRCGGNTRTKVREDTVLYHQPIFCPRCKMEFLANLERFHLAVIDESGEERYGV